jgi:5-methyltetrahydropteroyltriglutamate--homocysteine methyltransferase
MNREVISELKAAGAEWIQLDEPTLVLDLEAHTLDVFKHAYSTLGSQLPGVKLLIETYFVDLPVATYKYVLCSLMLTYLKCLSIDVVFRPWQFFLSCLYSL